MSTPRHVRPIPAANRWRSTATGLLAGGLLVINTLLWVPLLMLAALAKLLVPLRALRLRADPLLTAIAQSWIGGNSAWMRLTQSTHWDVQGVSGLDPRGWYLVCANHQSWVDILVLQHLLNRRIPLLKFFLKQQLIWVPVMGLAWWALDFPFMRRHSEDVLRKHPELRLRDQQTTRRACEKFALIPTSVMNFLEGTRYTPAKHQRQQSPYRHLLKPKTGGLAIALDAMGHRFQAVLDVTIVYPDGAPTFWDFLCGRLDSVVVRLRQQPIPAEMLGLDYGSDAAARQACARWVHSLWMDKDALIDALLAEARAVPRTDGRPPSRSTGPREKAPPARLY
ncbi:MAG: acyltransferase [Rhodoferax sp.]|nr:acyltransferase [Rhodoferax sp.]